MAAPKSELVHFRVDPQLRRRVQAATFPDCDDAHTVTMSEAVRRLLHEALAMRDH